MASKKQQIRTFKK